MASKNRDWFLNEWFYQVLLMLLGIALLTVNLGYISEVYISYWPLLLVVTAVKEMMEHN